MGIRGLITTTAAFGALLLSVPACALAATADVNANGNAFTGGLNFDPREVEVEVGDTVRWTNTDAVVPHTVTEEHGLFDLAGDYGGTPANPPGFGPGETVERRFSAGSFIYICEVHPEMVGQVRAPVDLKRRGSGKRARVVATWAAEELPTGQVFDVQRAEGSGSFRTVRGGTRELGGRFKIRPGQKLSFQARVRLEADPAAASDYSPPAKVKFG